MIEAMRILKASGLKPRRTIRMGLWTGEEQGLLGSRAYVTKHFADRADIERCSFRAVCRRSQPRPKRLSVPRSREPTVRRSAPSRPLLPSPGQNSSRNLFGRHPDLSWPTNGALESLRGIVLS